MLAPALAMTLLATSSGVGAGLPAPEIQAKDWKNHAPTTIEAQSGRVVVLEFWATW